MATDLVGNSDAGPGVTAWVVGGTRTIAGVEYTPNPSFDPYYIRPIARDRYYDPRPMEALNVPKVSRRLLWSRH
ncbi:MAG: hypothetical protein AB1758_26230, partial [Candidatus Eremiobacterota bacterium]